MTDYNERNENNEVSENTQTPFQSYYAKPTTNYETQSSYGIGDPHAPEEEYEPENKPVYKPEPQPESPHNTRNPYDIYWESEAKVESEREPEAEPQPAYTVNKIYVEEEKKKKKSAGSFMSYVAVILITSILSGFAGSFITKNMLAKNSPAESQIETSANTITIDGNVENVAQAVAKKAKDSVVAVTSVNISNDWFYGQRVSDAMGSGIIVTEDGYILTNSHVISSGVADQIKVFLSDQDIVLTSETLKSETVKKLPDPEKTGYPAKIIWNDSANDVALIKIEPGKKLQAAELGDSSAVEIGQIVVAIGNPIAVNFKSTVTQGIISGLDREVSVQVQSNQEYESPYFRFSIPETRTNTMTGLIQTDAAINSGNSGGPLLNSKGQVIGVNTLKAGAAGIEGLGFAIPINTIKPLLAKLDTGDFRTVLLGITGYSVEEYEQMVKVELTFDEGLIVMQVLEDSPAAKAGIQPHDIITEIDGQKISTIAEVRNILSSYKLGDKGKVTLYRSGEKKTLDITYDKYSDTTQTETTNE